MTCNLCFETRAKNRITRERAEKSIAKMKALTESHEKLKADEALKAKPSVEEFIFSFDMCVSYPVGNSKDSLFESVAYALWSDATVGNIIKAGADGWAKMNPGAPFHYPSAIADVYCVCIKILDAELFDVIKIVPSDEHPIKSVIWLLRNQGFYKPLTFM